jgi:hypothetical protein
MNDPRILPQAEYIVKRYTSQETGTGRLPQNETRGLEEGRLAFQCVGLRNSSIYQHCEVKDRLVSIAELSGA